jgi:cytoplasmic iron level regulating protein YaaA (DUF328/UPF0246 family)
MLVVISPAKNLDYDTPAATDTFTQPEMLDDSQTLITHCQTLSPAKIGSLMKISDKLAGLNADRYASWHTPFDTENAKQALLAFNGDVYTGLDASSFRQKDFDYAQQHLRILSGLYGVLRPLDLMQPYRLEMGIKLKTEQGKSLYDYWDKQITELLNEDIAAQGDNVLVNLASNEYFSAVKKKSLDAMVITPQFKDEKNGQYKIISFYAKKARGMMARYVIENKLRNVTDLKDFDYGGYAFDEASSTESEYVFKRAEQ